MSSSRSHRQPKVFSIGNSSRLTRGNRSAAASTQSVPKSRQASRSKKPNPSGTTVNADANESEQFRIFDDRGTDVTPRPISDYIRMKVSNLRATEPSSTQAANQQLIENLNSSISEKSFIGTTNLTMSTSRTLPTGTLFSAGDRATLDIATKIITEGEHWLAQSQHDLSSRSSSMRETVPARFLPGMEQKEADAFSPTIFLSETETIFIVDMISDVVSPDDETDHQNTDQKNHIYTQLCTNRLGNDSYVERGMQTFNDLAKHENIVTDPVWMRSQQVWVDALDLHDSLIEASQYEGKIYRQCRMHDGHSLKHANLKSPDRQHESVEGKMLSTVSSKAVSSRSAHGLTSEESIVKMTSSKSHCFDLNADNEGTLPAIDVDALIMERMLNLNIYSAQQQTYRGSRIHDDARATVSLTEPRSLTLERLWRYISPLTQGRNVSCLCRSEKNPNLLAVGYGKFQYNDDAEGLVCCWSTKNPEFPERYYQTDAGVTALSFSLKRPNLLAVGLFNGHIYVFDLNHNNTQPIVHTNGHGKKHRNPIWQLAWNERDRSFDVENIEVLISISSDGRITQWILRKEFEATDVMRLKPFNFSQKTCQTVKKNGETFTNEIFSSWVGGLCFDIRSNDKTIYLCGTDEGLIHRCSTIYNEKYLESYRGHTGPVYKVHWSPFVENVFLSASADWTVRIWMIEHEEASMVFSSSTFKAVVDAIWSPKSATMFFCISENTIEIWDLSQSTLDPIYIARSSEQTRLTSIVYATDSDCLLVGTNDGAVWIYHLNDPPSIGSPNDLITIVQHDLLSQRHSADEKNLHENTSLASVESY